MITVIVKYKTKKNEKKLSYALIKGKWNPASS